VEIIAILVAGPGLLVGRRHWLAHQDAEATEATGGEWRSRSELPLDAGWPYAAFAPDIFLAHPADLMEGTDEGFGVVYFTVHRGGAHRQPKAFPAAIVQVPGETPKFRYVTEDLDDDAPKHLASLRRHTPPHYEGGRDGQVGPRTSELLAGARAVIVETAAGAVWVQSRGATQKEVQRLTLALARAMVADAATIPPPRT